MASAYPARQMAQAIRQRERASAGAAQRDRSGPRRWLVPVGAVAASACLVAAAVSLWPAGVARVFGPSNSAAVVEEGARTKGETVPVLVLHRRVGDGSEELDRSATARQGDLLRIGYRAAGHRFGAILSIDGRGQVTQHLPRDGDRAVPLEPTGTTFLDASYELDDAPRWEAFYFVTADAAFDLEPVRRAVRDAAGAAAPAPARLALPPGLTPFLFTLAKAR
jgi:hypothetical protein